MRSSEQLTRLYSTSFTWGIRVLHPELRQPIYSIYGLVRLADEIVDTFFDADQARLLQELEEATYQALDRGLSVNPVLQAFQLTARRFDIERSLVEAFFHSMRMDLKYREHDGESYAKYIYGSAEVVGLMCLRVFCQGDGRLYDELAPMARRLGAAFQKVNFLRDLRSDYVERGRMYFPGVRFDQLSQSALHRLAAEIEEDFQQALPGIRRLPRAARQGVYLAYRYFRALLEKIRKSPPQRVQQERIRINNTSKLLLWAHVYIRHATGLL